LIVIVSLAAVESDTKAVELDATPEEIHLAPPAGYEVHFDRAVKACLSTRRVGEEFFLRGQAETDVAYTCVRCLTQFRAAHSAPLDVVVHRVDAPQGSDVELDNYVEVPLGTSEFNLGPYVREALLLALREIPHCREDCRGICAHCGADLNMEPCTCPTPAADPRWEALRQFTSAKR
jgi:uncharacterized protein